VPIAPTALPGNSTSQLATTAFVSNAVTASIAGVASFNTRVGAVTLTTGDITGAGGAPVISPVLSGTPTAPTPIAGTNSTQIATTAFVQSALATGGGVTSWNGRAGVVTMTLADVTGVGGAPLASPAFTGTPTTTTPLVGDNSGRIVNTAFLGANYAPIVNPTFQGTVGIPAGAVIVGYAPLASPSFTGVPTGPTAAPGTSTTELATTAFVSNAVTSVVSVTSFNTRTGAITLTGADITGAGGALLASPVFTGDPQAPTPVAGDNDNSIATTAFVNTAVAGLTTVYMRWVPYTGPPQSFLSQDVTRDGDWTMVANKNTSDRPAPQASGTEEDLLPAWTPLVQSARATYTAYNEWTLSSAGWVDQYGANILSQNTNALHTVTLRINGVTRDTFTATPTAAGLWWNDITPIMVPVGTVVRVTVQVTQTGSNLMYWQSAAGLFATPPTYCSLAVGSKDGAAAGTTAYDCHVMFIPGTYSPDWDVLAFGGSAAPGGSAGGPPVYVGVSPPVSLSVGNLWWDTNGGNLYVWYDDGTSQQWVPTTNQPGAASVFTGAIPPSSPQPNALWWDSVGGQLYIWYNDGNSTQWVVANNTQAGVASFNSRQGAVTLTPADVRAASTGVVDGSNAAAGQIGEFLSASGGPVALTTGAIASAATLNLTAGDWDVWPVISFSPSGQQLSQFIAAVNTALNLTGINYFNLTTGAILGGGNIPGPVTRFSFAATTPVYALAQTQFASGTCNAYGWIYARRVR
jgi:hypothetical protein